MVWGLASQKNYPKFPKTQLNPNQPKNQNSSVAPGLVALGILLLALNYPEFPKTQLNPNQPMNQNHGFRSGEFHCWLPHQQSQKSTQAQGACLLLIQAELNSIN